LVSAITVDVDDEKDGGSDSLRLQYKNDEKRFLRIEIFPKITEVLCN
jgi:hypothetical protein